MPEAYRSIVVIRAGALGDTLMTTPLLSALRERNPDAKIDYVCSPAAVQLLATNPHIATLYPLRWRNLPMALASGKRRVRNELREAAHDLTILLETHPRYEALLQRGASANVLRLTDPLDPDLHMVVQNLSAGGVDPAKASLDTEVYLTQADRARAGVLLDGLEPPIVAMHAGYGWGGRRKKHRQGERLKGWASENFARVARHLIDRGGRVVLTGSSADLATATEIERMVGSRRLRVLCGKTTVRELAAVIEHSALAVMVDTAAAHIAAAVGTPLVVLWGPARLRVMAPSSSSTPIRVVRHPPWCAPCYGTPRKNACRRNICMEAITPEEIIDHAEELLGTHAEVAAR